jgi:predicted kinase
VLLARNEVNVEEAAALDELLARFHLGAAVSPWTGAAEKTSATCDSVFGNLTQLLARAGPLLPRAETDRLISWTRDSARTLKQRLLAREQAGFIRECHGDLHAANVVRWRDRLRPFDCIEFDPQLRSIDVINDISFLLMDLMSRQRADLACALLSRYLEVTGDYDGACVLPFYAAYRALVRAKVDVIGAEQVASRADEFHNRMQQRIRAALAWMTPSQPFLILMHGVSGSGKTWLSERLLPELSAVRVRSDVERKRLAHMAGQRARARGHPPRHLLAQFSRRTYERLAECAENCLRAGLNTIVDAAFLDPAERALFHALARRLDARFAIVACRADARLWRRA